GRWPGRRRSAWSSCAPTSTPGSATWRCGSRPGTRKASCAASSTRSRPRSRLSRDRLDEIAADWILDNGRIITLDPRRPSATGLPIERGRVVAVGGRAELRLRRDRRTRVIDLAGATVIPGLVDAHAHLDREGLKYLQPSLAGCRSIADIQAVVRAQAARRGPGEWIVTMPVGAPPFYLDPPAGPAAKRRPTPARPAAP